MQVRSAVVTGGAVVAGFLASVVPGVAHADFIDPTPYVDANGVAWFNMAGDNCSIAPNGVVGCDLPSPAPIMSMTIAGMTIPVPYVPAVAIDTAYFPSHPQWGSNGSHTQQGGNTAIVPGVNQYTTSVNYAGATCTVSVRDDVVCSGMSHEFRIAGLQASGN
ncbi:hypothetical protein [Nocardia sp. NPDC046763]|uniref:hypothetical protein n=1 Tax=Nocardia sp. NPDC046763 TaxID=3155256 RepID=UPI0033CD0914